MRLSLRRTEAKAALDLQGLEKKGREQRNAEERRGRGLKERF